ncbi:MAG: cytochrome c oxidase subunit 3 family protein [Bacteroidetes bacterium]|nr:cytochrome c oxidase subunit 3 family protein [Bacteroidota bacterium]
MSDHAPAAHAHVHRDDYGSKLGMWFFIFTEILLFGALFIVYAIYRFKNPDAFFAAGQQLSTVFGTINTVILLVSSMTIAMSISALQQKHKKLAIWLMVITLVLASSFLVNKYFEWSAKFHHGIYPGSDEMAALVANDPLGQGKNLFFFLYYFMTGLHGAHVIIGMGFIIFVMRQVMRDELTHDNFARLENAGLYWHLVDLIWIYLFPLFYLIH